MARIGDHQPHPKSKEAQRQIDDVRRSIRTRLMVGIAAVVLVGAGAFALTTRNSSELAAGSVPAGARAPDLSFDLFDGTRASIDDFAGTPVVLNFWASWCPACVAEMPDFEKVHQEFGETVQFLGMDTQDTSRSAADDLVHSTGVSYLLASDPTGVIYREFGGIAMPTTVFIDASGNILDVHSGALFADDLAGRIDDLFFSS